MNAKEKYFLLMEDKMNEFKEEMKKDYYQKAINSMTREEVHNLTKSTNEEELRIGWTFSLYEKLKHTYKTALKVKDKQLYFIDKDNRQIMIDLYYRHFQSNDPHEQTKGSFSIYTNDTFKMIEDKIVLNDFGYYGRSFIDTFKLPKRNNEVFDGEYNHFDNRGNRVFIYQDIIEDYYNAIINFDFSTLDENVEEQARTNQYIAKNVLSLIKKYSRPLVKNEDYYNQYWTPRWSEVEDMSKVEKMVNYCREENIKAYIASLEDENVKKFIKELEQENEMLKEKNSNLIEEIDYLQEQNELKDINNV